MKNTYYQQQYKCANGHITKHYIWSNDIKKAKHTCDCGKKITAANIYTELDIPAPGIRTPTKNR